jgi:RNA polymerase sigma factor (sigma-70 family)
MTKRWELTQEAFDSLLTWLDPDREQAGKKYEYIRQSLVRILIWRGCSEAEDLADETINRVARKVPAVAATYQGNPALYFYGVARNVLLEYQKRQAQQASPPAALENEAVAEQGASVELEKRHACMEQCLRQLSDSDRALIRRYYEQDFQPQVDARKELARQLGLSPGALRVKAHRLRAVLLDCVKNCLASEAE